MKILQRFFLLCCFVLAVSGIGNAQQFLYWKGLNLPWSNPAGWSTNETSGGSSSIAPGADRKAVFNQTSANANAQTIVIDSPTSALGIIVFNSGPTTFVGNNPAGQTLDVGSTGFTMNAGAGPVIIGDTSNPVLLNGGGQFNNYSSNSLVIRNNIDLIALNLSGPGGSATSTFVFEGIISGGLGNGSGNVNISNGAIVEFKNTANSFTGITSVSGENSVLIYSGGTATTTAQYGNGSGNIPKIIQLNGNATFRVVEQDLNINTGSAANPSAGLIFKFQGSGGVLDVAEGRTLTIDEGTGSSETYTGYPLQGTLNTTITKRGLGTLALGGSTGGNSNLDSSIVIAEGTLRISGTGLMLGASTAGTTIKPGADFDLNGTTTTFEPLTIGGSGRNGNSNALYNSSTTAATWNSSITLNADTSLGTTVGAMNIGGTITGAYNLTTRNDSAQLLKITSPINITGLLSNAGSGTGTTEIWGALKSTVTKVVQDSATSTLRLISAQTTYTNGVQLKQGLLVLDDATALGASGSSLTIDGGRLDIGSSSITMTGTYTQTWNADLYFVGSQSLTMNAGAISLGNSPTAIRIVTVLNNTLTLGGDISNGTHLTTPTTGLLKNGAGSLVLSGGNTFTGTTQIDQGTLVYRTQSSLYNSDSSKWTPANVNAASGTTIGFGITSFGEANIDALRTSGIFKSGVALGIDTSLGNGTHSLQIADTSAGSLPFVKLGTGTLTLGPNNTYTGQTQIRAGVLAVSSLNRISGGTTASGLGAPTTVATGTVRMEGTGTMRYLGTGETSDRNFSLNAAGAIDQSGTGNLQLTGSIISETMSSTGLTLLGSTAGTGELTQRIDNSNFSLTKTGSGTWTLSDNSNNLSRITVNAGVLRFSGTGNTVQNITMNGGTLDLGNSPLLLKATSFSIVQGSGNATIKGDLVLGTDAGDIGSSTSNPITIDGVISGPFGIDYWNAQYGTTVLGAANTYSGLSKIQNQKVVVSKIGSFGSGPSSLGNPSTATNANLQIGTSTSSSSPALSYVGTGEVTSRNIEVVGGTTSITLDQSGTGLLKFTGDLTSAVTAIKTINLTGSTTGTAEFAGSISNSSTGSVFSVNKSGTGTWILSGSNSYTGTTTISGGTLIVNGGVVGNVTMSSLSSLGGSGTIGGNVTGVGNVSPGNSIGTLFIDGNLFITGLHQFEISKLTTTTFANDRIFGINTLTYDGILQVTLASDSLSLVGGESWDLYDFTTRAGVSVFDNNVDFGKLGGGGSLPAIAPNLSWAFNYSEGTLSVVAIPEPTAIGGIIGVLICTVAIRRTIRRTVANLD